MGLVLSFSLSFSASEQIGVKSLTFFIKHSVFTCGAIIILLTISTISQEKLKWICFCGLFIFFVLLAITLFMPDVKGSRRWLYAFGFGVQPSEFLKPFFIYILSLLFTEAHISKIKNPFSKTSNHLHLIILTIYFCLILVLFLQPDFGMIVTFTLVLASFYFVNLKSIKYFIVGLLCLIFVSLIAGFFLEHVHYRIKVFILGLENYQSKLAIQAIQSGGFFGQGVIESKLKFKLPEAHNDFIFAILIEEFGFIFAAILGLLFLVMIFSNFLYIFEFKEKLIKMFLKDETSEESAITSKDYLIEENIKRFAKNKTESSKNHLNIYRDFLFCRNFIFATCILIFFEFFMNAAVSINLVPTKGMAMPFISYGGSSLISHGILIGLLFSFNRRRYFFLF